MIDHSLQMHDIDSVVDRFMLPKGWMIDHSLQIHDIVCLAGLSANVTKRFNDWS